MADRCGDNRFEIIKKAKAELLKSTNIETSEDEMKVLDKFLFRCGQMGWLERYDKPREPLDIPTMTTDFIKEHGFPCPTGYIFKDENGNVINAIKIIVEKKKKEYPKTYEECCKVLNFCGEYFFTTYDEGIHFPENDNIVKIHQILKSTSILIKLIICRDAYWKIAGDEMGLGKPWEPDYDSLKTKYTIVVVENKVVKLHTLSQNHILTFPTEEMRDAFYENFKELIESVKELL